jgi:hypothetical protein
VLDGPLDVDQTLLALFHETLQLLLELGVSVPAVESARRRILKGLDRQVDLAVFLDGDDLGLDRVVHVEVVLDAPDVVSVDLGDMHEADLAAFEGDERSVRGDPLNGSLDDGADL